MSFAKNWIRPEVYPVIAVVAAGVGFSGFYITRKMIRDSDIIVNKKQPMQFTDPSRASSARQRLFGLDSKLIDRSNAYRQEAADPVSRS